RQPENWAGLACLAESGGVTHPPAQPHVKQRQQERNRGRGMVAGIRAGRRPRDTHSRPNLDAFIVGKVVCSRITVLRYRLVIVAGIGCFSIYLGFIVAAIERREYERGRFSLLPREEVSSGQIQRRIQNRIRTTVVLFGKIFQWDIVFAVETNERIGTPLPPRGTQITPDKPVFVEVMHRKIIDVNAPGENEADDQEKKKQRTQSIKIDLLRSPYSSLGRLQIAGIVPF